MRGSSNYRNTAAMAAGRALGRGPPRWAAEIRLTGDPPPVRVVGWELEASTCGPECSPQGVLVRPVVTQG